MSARSTHAITKGMVLFSLLYISPIYSLQDAGGFHVRVIVNNVTIHTQVKISLTDLGRVERKEEIFDIKRCQLCIKGTVR